MSSTFASIVQAQTRAVLGYVGVVLDAKNGIRGKRWEDCRAFFGNQCAYCGKPLGPKEGHREHVFAMNSIKWGCGSRGNVVLACKECDNEEKKGDVEYEDLIRMLAPSSRIADERIDKIKLHFKMCRFEHDPGLVKAIAESYIAAYKEHCIMMETKIKTEVNLGHPAIMLHKPVEITTMEIDPSDIWFGI